MGGGDVEGRAAVLVLAVHIEAPPLQHAFQLRNVVAFGRSVHAEDVFGERLRIEEAGAVGVAARLCLLLWREKVLVAARLGSAVLRRGMIIHCIQRAITAGVSFTWQRILQTLACPCRAALCRAVSPSKSAQFMSKGEGESYSDFNILYTSSALPRSEAL